MKRHDLKVAFGVALAVEAILVLLTLLNPHWDLAFDSIGLFHFIPLFTLAYVEFLTNGAISTGGPLFYPLLLTLQVVVLTLVLYVVLRVIRNLRQRRLRTILR